jgi:hypothetical protein
MAVGQVGVVEREVPPALQQLLAYKSVHVKARTAESYTG